MPRPLAGIWSPVPASVINRSLVGRGCGFMSAGTAGVSGLIAVSEPNSVCGRLPCMSGITVAKNVPSGIGVVLDHAISARSSATSTSAE